MGRGLSSSAPVLARQAAEPRHPDGVEVLAGDLVEISLPSLLFLVQQEVLDGWLNVGQRGVVALRKGQIVTCEVTEVKEGGIDVKIVQFAPYDGVTDPTTITGSVDVGTAEAGEAVNLSFSPEGASRILGAVPLDLGSNGIWSIYQRS